MVPLLIFLRPVRTFEVGSGNVKSQRFLSPPRLRAGPFGHGDNFHRPFCGFCLRAENGNNYRSVCSLDRAVRLSGLLAIRARRSCAPANLGAVDAPH